MENESGMSKVPGNADLHEGPGMTLLKNSEWRAVDGEFCRVIDFVPLGAVRKGKVVAFDRHTPFASVVLQCKKLPPRTTGFITHKRDFIHLWLAFKERTIKSDEEVIIIWSEKYYNNILAKMLHAFMPKLWVMVCPKGAYELMVDASHRPELTGEARWNATRPIVDWKAPVMK